MAVSIGEYKQAVEALAQRMKAFYDRAIVDIEKEWEKNYIPGSKFANEIEALAQETNQEIDDKFVGRFCHKAVMTLMLKFIFQRFAEDKKILKSYFRSETTERWQKDNKEAKTAIREAFEKAREKFKGLYKTTVYDEFLPSETTLKTYLIDALSDEPKSGLYKGKGSLDFATLDPRVVSAFYEKLFDRKKRKKLGLFFTPPVIADYLVEKVFKSQKITKNFLVLDPACGSGQILLAAYRRLKDIFMNQLGMTLGEAHKQILSHNLWGIDIEPFAVLLSKINLALQNLENIPEYINIIHGDSLLETGFDIPQMAMLKDVGNSQKQKLIKETIKTQGGKEIIFWRNGFGRILFEKPVEQKMLFELVERMKRGIFFEEAGIRTMKDLPREFDAVVANPPYGAFIIKNYKKELDQKFQTNEKKYDSFVFFIEYGILRLKNKGKLSFIIPNTFLTRFFSKKLRLFILDNTKIVLIMDIPISVFEDSIVDNVILILQKSLNLKNRLKNKIAIIRDVVSLESIRRKESSYFISQELFYREEDHMFNIYISPNAVDLVLKIKKSSIPFIQIGKAHPGGIVTSDDKKYIFPYNKGRKCRPYCEGKDVHRWESIMQRLWIDYSRKKEFRVQGIEPVYLLPQKIVLQRVTGGYKKRLVATIDNQKYYMANSTNIMYLTNKDFDIKYVLALINSTLINFYYKVLYAETNTNITKTVMERLPISPASPEQQKPLIEMADKMLKLNKKLQETKKSFYELVSKEIENKIPLREIEELDFVNIKDSHAKLGDKGKIGAKQKNNTVVVAINKRPTVKIVCRDEVAAEFLMKYLNDLRSNILSGKDGDSWIERVLNTKIHWDKKSNLYKILNQHKTLQSSTKQLKQEIDETDKKIDEMVYDLYGITKEERKIIEESMV